ncbi:hypothetical protein BO94DRAFT_558064 [Aspergillus sclerotioniger CBS 115572]|uniref:ATP-grasp domain-containing protein n=1 Tax=Aspergillus sclerotioniger CBS 115572 TaxID=1450535 RepID=A0A317W4Z4_9EURO|nr:hypothetical protein BO94DRAFT_558064 [Aspergillus sclerotioniger CBS 115572]PWY81634.1 hypothetical protein BO94DRAFT_558064 [Aspergillus sclerotioniger CBS 115572]
MRPVIETPRILFLTTQQPHTIRAEWPYYQNYDLPLLLKDKGALVAVKSWMDEDILTALNQYDTVTFLWCNEYYKHPKAFFAFLDKVDKLVKTSPYTPHVAPPRIINDTKLEGFVIPKTRLVDPQRYTVAELQQLVQNFHPSGSVVLKPSMSASSTLTRRIADTSALSADDMTFLGLCTGGGLQSSLLIQEFESAISTGEYSFVFVGPHLTHVMVKSPQRGDFRVQDEYGGSAKLTDLLGIKLETIQVVQAVFESLQRRFTSKDAEEIGCGEIGYVRIDGLITDDRPFVLMEIEAIEPHLWLETGKGVSRMLSLLMD